MLTTLLLSLVLAVILLALAWLLLVKVATQWSRLWGVFLLVLFCFPFSLAAYISCYTFLAKVANTQLALGKGVLYSREATSFAGGRAIVHVVKMDLSAVEVSLTPSLLSTQW